MQKSRGDENVLDFSTLFVLTCHVLTDELVRLGSRYRG